MSIPGVTFNKQTGKWRATLKGYTASSYIGEYETEEQATAARQAAELAFHGYVHEQADIEVSGDTARVPLHGANGVIRAWVTIDAGDVELIRGPCWCISVSGYAVARVSGALVYMHRVILPGDGVGDHINGEKLDNRQANLRRCSQAQNVKNQRANKPSRSGIKGVRRTPEGRYAARITVDRKEIGLGRFDTAEEAAAAYDAAAVQHFGEFASINAGKVYAATAGVDVTVSADVVARAVAA